MMNETEARQRGTYERNIEGLRVTFQWYPRMRIYTQGREGRTGGWGATIHAKKGSGTLPGPSGRTLAGTMVKTRTLLRRSKREHVRAHPVFGPGRDRSRSAGRDPSRVIYISRSQNLAHLIDNAYGHLTSREASGLMRVIDDADREGEDPRRAAIGYLRQIGVTVRVTDGRDASRRPSRDASEPTVTRTGPKTWRVGSRTFKSFAAAERHARRITAPRRALEGR